MHKLKALLLLVHAFLIIACNDSDEPSFASRDCTDCTFFFYQDKTIEVGLNATNTVTLLEGNNLVFRFTRPVFNHGSELFEDRAVLFQIESSWDPFEFSDNSLARLLVHEGIDDDGLEGPGVLNFARDLSQGSIEGRKLDNDSWEIIFNNVRTSFGDETFRAVFTRK